jgi:hypothetical protein
MDVSRIPRVVRASIWLFRLLLRAYPAEFRRGYAAEKERAFRTQCREAYRLSGCVGILRLWPATLGDWLASMAGERLSGENAVVEMAPANMPGNSVRLHNGGMACRFVVFAGALFVFTSMLYGFARYPSGFTADSQASLVLLALELACCVGAACHLTAATWFRHLRGATACGLGIGAIWLAYDAVANLTFWGPDVYRLVVVATLYGSLALLFLAGVMTPRTTGRVDDSIRAGAWAGLIGALAAVLGNSLVTYPFMDRVLSLNRRDPGFLHSGMHDVAAWTVQDALGGAVCLLLLGPLFGGLIGGAGGLAWRVRVRPRAGQI